MQNNTKNLLIAFTATLEKSIVKKISKIIRFPREQDSWNSSTRCFTSLYKRKSKKMTIGRDYLSSSQAQTPPDKENIRSWNSSGQIMNNLNLKIRIAFTVLMQI